MRSSKLLYIFLSGTTLILSLYIQFLFANFFHANKLDLFYLGISICGVIISMSSGGVGGYLISRFSQEINKLSLNIALTSFLIIFIAVGFLVFIILAYTSIYILKIDLYESLIISFLFVCYLLSLALNIIYQSYSYCQKGFSGALGYEVCSLISYTFIIVLVLTGKGSFIFCCTLFCLRGYVQTLVYYLSLIKKKNNECFNISDVKVFLSDVRILMSGSAYYKSEPIVDRFFLIASSHGLTGYHLISQIYNAVLGLWYKVSVSPLVQKLSRNRDNTLAFKLLFRRGVLEQGLIIVIAAIIIFFTPFIGFFSRFEIFKPVTSNVDIIYLLFGFFAASLLGQVISNAYYSIGNAKIPVVVSCITYTFFLPAKYFIVNKYGINGLCVLVSVYHSSNLIILWLLFRKKYFNEKKS